MVIQWIEEKHALGIPQVDRQHRELFQITNALAQAQERLDDPDRKSRLIAALKRLYAYCHFHFQSEEEMLLSLGFPGLGDHRRIHRAFTDRVRLWLQDTRDAAHPDLAEAQDACVAWILDHILGEDRAYTDYLRTHGAVFPDDSADDGRLFQDWDKNRLGLEIQGIDDQHKELIRILQQANDLILAALPRQRLFLPTVIRKLFYYTQFHFSFEEELMSRHRWTGLAAHRQLHQTFVRKILGFHQEYEARNVDGLAGEMVVFLKEWIVQHILEEDRKFKATLGTGG
jgi:hemerythrin-like metal-binding protein